MCKPLLYFLKIYRIFASVLCSKLHSNKGERMTFKKVILGSLLFAFGFVGLNALDGTAIQQEIEKKLKQKVEKLEIIPYSSGLSLVTIQVAGERAVFFVSNDGKRLFSSNGLVWEGDEKLLASYKQTVVDTHNFNSQRKNNKIISYANSNPQSVVSLKSNKKTKLTKYLVVDPTCPYCVDEIENIQTMLNDYNVKIIVVAYLSKTAELKTNYFFNQYQSFRQSKDARAKTLALLKEVFSKRMSIQGKNVKANASTTENTNAMGALGINAVPFSFVR